jgi:signal transduction histidine kinase
MQRDNVQRVARGRLAAEAEAAPGSSRIDWRHCTLLPNTTLAGLMEKEGLAAAPMDDSVRQAISDTFEQVALDENAALYMATADGRLVYVNDGYRNLVRQCDLLRPPGDGGQEKNKLPDSLMSIFNEVIQTRRTVIIEEKLKVGNSLRRYRSRHFPIMAVEGRVAGVGGTYVDCTKEMENLEGVMRNRQRFLDFGRASSDWFWETDRELVFTYLSERLTAIIGKPTVMLLGKHISELGELVAQGTATGPGRSEKTIAYEALKRRAPFRDQLFKMQDAEGKELLFHLSGVPSFNLDNGEFEGFRGAGMDVTARFRAEQESLEVRHNLENTLEELTNKNLQLDVASATAKHALATKSEFLAGMSHELRTPLNAIIGFAEAMKLEVFGELNSHYKSYSEDIMNAGRHLLGLINDVLDVAVIENNKIKLDCEYVPLKELVDAALSLVIMRANQKSQDTSAVKADPKWEIYVDRRRATQVLVNLLSNSVKFTPEKGKIGIDVTAVKGRPALAITVWDTGMGIREEELELVFEKFHQSSDSVYSRREEGTGLGLNISRQLSELMGGSLTLESIYGEGSRFTAILPTKPLAQKTE